MMAYCACILHDPKLLMHEGMLCMHDHKLLMHVGILCMHDHKLLMHDGILCMLDGMLDPKNAIDNLEMLCTLNLTQFTPHIHSLICLELLPTYSMHTHRLYESKIQVIGKHYCNRTDASILSKETHALSAQLHLEI